MPSKEWVRYSLGLLKRMDFGLDLERGERREAGGRRAHSRDEESESPIFFVVVALKRLQPLEKR